jgi:hypothetical protein
MKKNLFVTLLEKVFGLRIVRVPSEKKKQAIRDKNYYEHIKSRQTTKAVEVADNKREITPEEQSKAIEDIMAGIFAKGYKAIPEILSEYPEQIVRAWVVMQKIALGDYAPEMDIMDDMSIEDLIQIAVELNQLQFQKRMIEQGRANISKPQKELIERLITQVRAKDPSFAVDMPKDKFAASELIDELNKKLGNTTGGGTILVNNMTERQLRKLTYLCATLDREIPKVNSVKEASEIIGKMQAELDEHPELNKPVMASKAQIEYMRRLYKQEGKRWTKQSEAKYKKLTLTQMSNELQKKRAEITALHPELNMASEGQVRYMKDLMIRLSVPFNAEDLPKLTKEQATKKIDSLRRDLLYILCKTTSPMTKEEIKAMSTETVKELLNQIQMERKTNHYQENAEVVDNKYATV